MSKYFLVNNKPDDYNNCKQELVHTSVKNAKEYYNYAEVSEQDVSVLRKYMSLVSRKEEQERTNEERFYGTE